MILPEEFESAWTTTQQLNRPDATAPRAPFLSVRADGIDIGSGYDLSSDRGMGVIVAGRFEPSAGYTGVEVVFRMFNHDPDAYYRARTPIHFEVRLMPEARVLKVHFVHITDLRPNVAELLLEVGLEEAVPAEVP